MAHASSVCSTAGCPNLNPCPKHRPSSRRRGYDERWARRSRLYRSRHPRCEWPGCTAASEQVDHINGQRPTGLEHDDDLIAYCVSHHSQKTVAFDGGLGHS